jgi:hypothetical protein
LEFPLTAYHTIQYLVKQLNLLIPDQTIWIALEAKQLLLTNVLSNNTCMIAVPLSTSISSTNPYTSL